MEEALIDVICFSETWLRPEIESTLLYMPGFELVRLDRSTLLNDRTKTGGGLCFYVKKCIIFNSMPTLNVMDSDIEIQIIEIKNANCRDMYIVNTYRPPSGNSELAVDRLREICLELTSIRGSKDIIIVGDLNINLLTNTSNKKLICDLCDEFNLTSNINLPTRVTSNSSSCLDLILSSITHTKSSGVIQNNISDHFPTFIVKKKLTTKYVKTTFRGRSYRFYDDNEFKMRLLNYNWGRFYAAFDVDTAWQELYQCILDVSDELCPVKTFYFRDRKPAWYNDELVELSTNRDEFFRIGKASKDESLLNLAREYRNKLKTGIKNARTEYYTTQINENRANPSKFWNCIQELIPGNKSDKIGGVRRHETDDVCSPSESPDVINQFFTGIGPELDSRLPDSFDPKTDRPQIRTLRFEPTISVRNVVEHLREIKQTKPSGCNKISTKLYLAALSVLTEQITFIFNLSIKTNRIPLAWKIGYVTPLPKKGDTTLLTNIRPITITHLCGKILEKLIATNIDYHCENNSIYTEAQMGFRKNRSTTMATSELICHINHAMNQNYFTICTFIDFKKAFDCVNFDRLLTKLINIGIDYKNIDWLKDYFTNRVQSVKMGDKISSVANVKCGVPQGSVLGPLLFLIYVNDLPNLQLDSHILMYADDVVLFNSGPNLNDIVGTMQKDVSLIANWSNYNRLTINFTKSNYMVFGNKYKLHNAIIPNSISSDLFTLTKVDNFMYLGVKLDNHLSFEPLILDLTRRLSNRIFTLSIVRKDITTSCAVLLYKTIILPIIDYGNFCLTPCSDKLRTKLQRLQNRALRICFKAKRRDSVIDLHIKASLATLDKRRELDIIKIFHNKVYNDLNQFDNTSIVEANFQNINDNQVPITRSMLAPQIHTQKPNSEKFRRSLLYTGTYLWNSLSTELRNIVDHNSFKLSVKRELYRPFRPPHGGGNYENDL